MHSNSLSNCEHIHYSRSIPNVIVIVIKIIIILNISLNSFFYLIMFLLCLIAIGLATAQIDQIRSNPLGSTLLDTI